MAKKVNFICGGISCPHLLLDMKEIKESFIEKGFSEADYDNADLVVYGTCAFINEPEKTCIEEIKKISKDKELIVYGCLVDISKDKLKSVFDGQCFSVAQKKDIVRSEMVKIKSRQPGGGIRRHLRLILESIKGCIPIKTKWNLMKRMNVNINHLLNNKFVGFVAPCFIEIAEGCVNNCSYCVIKKARGDIKSIPIEEIIVKIKKAYKLGHRNFVFVGEDIGAYGLDHKENLVDLIEEVVNEFPSIKIELYSFNPHFFVKYFDEMEKFFKKDNISYIGCPLQSGSNRIIKFMNRDYNVEDVLQKFIELKKINKKTGIFTDFMVGFPEETDDDFERTIEAVKFCKSICFTIGVFMYSNKLGTFASGLDQLSEEIKLKRYNLIKNIINNKP